MYAFRDNMTRVCVCGEDGTFPPITITLINGTRTFDCQSNTPSETYTTNLSIKTLYPKGITYSPCLEGCVWRGGVIIKDTISGLSNYAEQNGCLKIFTGCVWRNCGRVALQSLLTFKKGPNPLNIQSNEYFSKFMRQLLLQEAPWSRTKKIIIIYCSNIFLYIGSAITPN